MRWGWTQSLDNTSRAVTRCHCGFSGSRNFTSSDRKISHSVSYNEKHEYFLNSRIGNVSVTTTDMYTYSVWSHKSCQWSLPTEQQQWRQFWRTNWLVTWITNQGELQLSVISITNRVTACHVNNQSARTITVGYFNNQSRYCTSRE